MLKNCSFGVMLQPLTHSLTRSLTHNNIRRTIQYLPIHEYRNLPLSCTAFPSTSSSSWKSNFASIISSSSCCLLLNLLLSLNLTVESVEPEQDKELPVLSISHGGVIVIPFIIFPAYLSPFGLTSTESGLSCWLSGPVVWRC